MVNPAIRSRLGDHLALPRKQQEFDVWVGVASDRSNPEQCLQFGAAAGAAYNWHVAVPKKFRRCLHVFRLSHAQPRTIDFQPRRFASAPSFASALTATAWSTASSKGRSLIESL